MTPADLAKEVDSRRAPYKRARDLRHEFRAATREKRERRQEHEAFIKDVELAVRSALGRNNPELVKFGFATERQRKPRTSEEKAMAAAKSRETREARHTMGAKQKQAIHGEVSAIKLVQEGSDVKSIPTEPSDTAKKPASTNNGR